MILRSVWYGLEGTGYDKMAQELKSEDPYCVNGLPYMQFTNLIFRQMTIFNIMTS